MVIFMSYSYNVISSTQIYWVYLVCLPKTKTAMVIDDDKWWIIKAIILRDDNY